MLIQAIKCSMHVLQIAINTGITVELNKTNEQQITLFISTLPRLKLASLVYDNRAPKCLYTLSEEPQLSHSHRINNSEFATAVIFFNQR